MPEDSTSNNSGPPNSTSTSTRPNRSRRPSLGLTSCFGGGDGDEQSSRTSSPDAARTGRQRSLTRMFTRSATSGLDESCDNRPPMPPRIKPLKPPSKPYSPKENHASFNHETWAQLPVTGTTRSQDNPAEGSHPGDLSSLNNAFARMQDPNLLDRTSSVSASSSKYGGSKEDNAASDQHD